MFWRKINPCDLMKSKITIFTHISTTYNSLYGWVVAQIVSFYMSQIINLLHADLTRCCHFLFLGRFVVAILIDVFSYNALSKKWDLVYVWIWMKIINYFTIQLILWQIVSFYMSQIISLLHADLTRRCHFLFLGRFVIAILIDVFSYNALSKKWDLVCDWIWMKIINYFTIQLIFATIYVFHYTFWYYLWVILYYFN